MISLAALAVFSALSLNLLLSFALGAAGILRNGEQKEITKIPIYQSAVVFFSVLFIWIIITYIFMDYHYLYFPFFYGWFF